MNTHNVGVTRYPILSLGKKALVHILVIDECEEFIIRPQIMRASLFPMPIKIDESLFMNVSVLKAPWFDVFEAAFGCYT